MTVDPPLLSVVTMSPWGPAFPRIVRWLSRGLQEIGSASDVVYLDGPPSIRGEGSITEVRLGAKHLRTALPALRRYLCERQPRMTLALPDIIGSATLLAGMGRLPTVPWVHNVRRLDDHDQRARVRAHRVASRYLWSRAARVAAVSTEVRESLAVDLAPWVPTDRLVQIPNPIDADEIRRLSRPPLERTGRLRFCSTGRLVWAKGFDILIQSMSLARLGQSWELLIVGEGPQRPELERLITRLGLSENVRLVGKVDNPYPIMASADVAVQASRWEGLPLVVLEGLALGIPLIATRSPGGIAEILGDGKHGILVAPESAAELASAISRMADDVLLRQSLSDGGPVVVEKYAPVNVAELVVNLAKEVAG